jgi:hypothetical protein
LLSEGVVSIYLKAGEVRHTQGQWRFEQPL